MLVFTGGKRVMTDIVNGYRPVIPVSQFLNPARQPACARNKYRTHSGECNNICFPTRGKESTVFIRLLGSDYADGTENVTVTEMMTVHYSIFWFFPVHVGIAEPRKNSQNRPLPSARFVSAALIGTKVRLAPTWTNMVLVLHCI